MTPEQRRRSMLQHIARAEQHDANYRAQRLAILQRLGATPADIEQLDRLDQMLDILSRIRGKANRALTDLKRS